MTSTIITGAQQGGSSLVCRSLLDRDLEESAVCGIEAPVF
jgi:hypothetical protein